MRLIALILIALLVSVMAFAEYVVQPGPDAGQLVEVDGYWRWELAATGGVVSSFEITTTGADTIGISYADAVDLRIEWGDSDFSVVNGAGTANHTYGAVGAVYTLTMQGECSVFRFLTNPSKLTAILSPIQGITGITNFYQTFYGCTSLTSLPTDLFRYNTLVAASGFYQTFTTCTNLTSIPADLFRYNILVSSSGFYGTFWGCTSLASIPVDLFRYNILVTTSGFYNTFAVCTSLTSIPVDLFRYNILVTSSGFYGTFQYGYVLTNAPSGLFKYNNVAVDFRSCFYKCNKLTMPEDLFYDSLGSAIDRTNRFAGLSVDFTGFFQQTAATTGGIGTAPDLWDAEGLFSSADAFTGHSTNSLSNWTNIPSAWGGPL